ncbi:MAG: hypothetical protein RMK35_00575 [Aquificaceae bacterium]|nr:hypothetical protein [Aquificaceae bacterium]
MLILKGKAKDLELLSTSISGLRGVKLSRLSGIALPDL